MEHFNRGFFQNLCGTVIENSNSLIRANADDATAHIRQDIFAKNLLILQLMIEIDILNPNSRLTSQAEENLKLVIVVGETCDALSEVEDTDQRPGCNEGNTRHDLSACISR